MKKKKKEVTIITGKSASACLGFVAVLEHKAIHHISI